MPYPVPYMLGNFESLHDLFSLLQPIPTSLEGIAGRRRAKWSQTSPELRQEAETASSQVLDVSEAAEFCIDTSCHCGLLLNEKTSLAERVSFGSLARSASVKKHPALLHFYNGAWE